MKKILSLAVVLVALCGCVHTAAIVHELQGDTNSINLKIQTVYGSISLERNLPYKAVLMP